MAPDEEIGDIDEPVEDEQPGEEEVPAPSHRQILFGRQASPRTGIARSSISPSGPREAPSRAGRVERPPEQRRHAGHGRRRRLSRAEKEKNGCLNWVAAPQLSAGRALKICSPLISSMRKQSALTQWQTRTRPNAGGRRAGRRPAARGCRGGTDAMAMSLRKERRSAPATDAWGRKFRVGQARQRVTIFS